MRWLRGLRIMQNASDAGVLSQLLQLPVVLESIALTDVPNDAALLAGAWLAMNLEAISQLF